MPDRILIIEDEEDLVLTLTDRLESEGYAVTAAYEGIRGEREAKQAVYDLIILDIMLPGQDGFEVCRKLRAQGMQTPILMLTARSTSIDTVTGLKTGADDYLCKPFDVPVQLARIEALLRRARKEPSVKKSKGRRHHFGEFVLDTHRQELCKAGKLIDLKAQEYKLLKFFVENPDRIIGRNEILDEVWGYDSITTTRTVDVHVAWIRRKLGEKRVPRFIHTLRGLGYRFSPEEKT